MTRPKRRRRRAPGAGVRVGGLAVLAFAILAIPVSAQEPELLDSTAIRVAAAWSVGDVDALARRFVPRGVDLHTLDSSHPALGERQARAAINELFATSGVGTAAVLQVKMLGGDPRKGFAELEWHPRPPGVREVLDRTLYIGFEARGGEWTIAEIRVLAEPDAFEPDSPTPHPLRWP